MSEKIIIVTTQKKAIPCTSLYPQFHDKSQQTVGDFSSGWICEPETGKKIGEWEAQVGGAFVVWPHILDGPNPIHEFLCNEPVPNLNEHSARMKIEEALGESFIVSKDVKEALAKKLLEWNTQSLELTRHK